MRKFYLFIAYVLCIQVISFAQDTVVPPYDWKSHLMDPNIDYFDIRKQTLEYLSQFPDSVVRRERKIFNRADYFLRSRVGSPDTTVPRSIYNYNKAILSNIYGKNLCPGTSNTKFLIRCKVSFCIHNS